MCLGLEGLEEWERDTFGHREKGGRWRAGKKGFRAMNKDLGGKKIIIQEKFLTKFLLLVVIILYQTFKTLLILIIFRKLLLVPSILN